MIRNLDLFVKSISKKSFYEGPLSDDTANIRVLFVMEEPHGEELNCFWMKEKVLTRKEGANYYHVLGAFAKRILNEKNNTVALKQCAYINFYPFKGGASSKLDNVTGKSYKNLIKDWKKMQNENSILDLTSAHSITFESANEDILCNRLKIIKNALENGIDVVAFHEIAEYIITDKNFANMLNKTIDYKDNNYRIVCFQYNNGAKLHSAPHPKTRGKINFNYTDLAKILNISSVYSE